MQGIPCSSRHTGWMILAQHIAVNWNIFLVHIFHSQIYLSTLSKHLIYIVAITSAVWGATARPAQIYLSCFTISWIDLFLTLATSAYFSLSLLSQERSPFHLKEALSSFSLAHPNCQQHYSYTLGSLLTKLSKKTNSQCPLNVISRYPKHHFCFFYDQWHSVVYILNPDNGFTCERLRNDSILSRCLFYPNWFIDPKQSQS